MTFIDLQYQPSNSLLESCMVTRSSSHNIIVECAYPGDSIATGFQVIAQLLSNSSDVHKLYVSKTTDRQTLVSVLVEENGLYQVTVFAIRGERGIVDSNVEYSAQLIVNLLPVVDTTEAGVDTTSKITPDNTAGRYTYSYNIKCDCTL